MALPCNLVIAPGGEVKARIFGAIAPKDNSGQQARSYDEALNHAQAGAIQTQWGRSEGDQLVAALADGFLTKG